MDDKKKPIKKLLVHHQSARNLERRPALIHELPGVPRDFIRRREVRFNLDNRLPAAVRAKPPASRAECLTARS